jgi:S1-C subfamily serine protease
VAGVATDAQGPSGLVPGDVIYGINGEPVRALADLRAAIAQVEPSGTPVLQVGREGQLRYLTVTIE